MANLDVEHVPTHRRNAFVIVCTRAFRLDHFMMCHVNICFNNYVNSSEFMLSSFSLPFPDNWNSSANNKKIVTKIFFSLGNNKKKWTDKNIWMLFMITVMQMHQCCLFTSITHPLECTKITRFEFETICVPILWLVKRSQFLLGFFIVRCCFLGFVKNAGTVKVYDDMQPMRQSLVFAYVLNQ